MMELKPCPICGRKPSKVIEWRSEIFYDHWFYVVCKNKQSVCNIKPRTGFHKTKEEAIEAWNRRAT